jgi:hypothetical protein
MKLRIDLAVTYSEGDIADRVGRGTCRLESWSTKLAVIRVLKLCERWMA